MFRIKYISKHTYYIRLYLCCRDFIFVTADHHQICYPIFLTAKYLTTTICISALSMIIQVAILNIYHKEPLVPVPVWLQCTIQCLSCGRANRRVTDEPMETKKKIDATKQRKRSVIGQEMQAANNVIQCETCKRTGAANRHDAVEYLREEWKQVGRVLDCLFFIVFIVIQLILIIFTFGMVTRY